MDYVVDISTTIIYCYFIFLNAHFLLQQYDNIFNYFSGKYPLFMGSNKRTIKSIYTYLLIPISFGLPLLFIILT